jgi:hypothetical protein
MTHSHSRRSPSAIGIACCAIVEIETSNQSNIQQSFLDDIT